MKGMNPLRLLRRLAALAAAGSLFSFGAPVAAQGTIAAPAAPRRPAAKAPVTPSSQTSYYGVYLQNAKVGSFVLTRTANATYKGARALRFDADMTLDMRVLGASAKVVNRTASWSDPKTGKPLFLDYKTQAAGVPGGGGDSRVTATYGLTGLTYQADIQGTKKTGTLALKPGESFLADAMESDLKPRPGLTMKGKVFSPDTLSLLDSEIRVVGREPVALGGQTVSGWRVVDKNTLANTTLWLNDEGDLLRQDAVMGIQIRREPKEVALAAPKAGAALDIAQATGIVPTGEKIVKPRTLRRAEYEISGLTKPLPLASDTVQTVAHEPDATPAGSSGALRARVSVTAGPLPSGPSAPLFAPGAADVPNALKPFLQSTLYVAADDPYFQALAKKVVGTETDTARAASKIADYVHKTITPDPSIAALRTATAIAKTPRGVCRDYTTYFTAIARAAGLPTKQCVGVGYADGKFFYHAWPEVWVGNETWIALEPTWGMPFADATHIKLAEGEITDVFNLAQDLGNYRIRVLRAE